MSLTVGERDTIDDAFEPGASVLDRSLNLAAVTWETIAWAAILLIALALRLVQLGGVALSPDEASHAFHAWQLIRGEGSAGAEPPQTAPLFLLLQALTLFLFGATDVIVRVVPALAGFAIVALMPALRPAIGRPAALGSAALAAISPTLVYASRVAAPEILAALLAVILVLIVIRATDDDGRPRWPLLAGITLGAMVAAGAAALTLLVSMLIGLALVLPLGPESAVARGARSLVRTPSRGLTLAAGFLATVLVLFTRFFSDPLAIAGVGETLAEWGRLLVVGPAQVPVQFFLFEVLLYEPLAVLMVVAAALGPAMPGLRRVGGSFLGGWLVASLLIWSFSAGRAPEHAMLVALPLILVGGAGLGEALARIDWRRVWTGPGGLLALVILGLILSVVAVGILITHPARGLTGLNASLPAVVIAMLVVVPLAYAAWMLTRAAPAEARVGQPGLIVLLVVATLLAGFTLRSAIMLSLYRAETGTELLAQQTASGAVLPTVQRLERLSRDVTVTDASARDVTGGHGLTIAAEQSVQWPFRWYFRDFPNFSVVPDGTAAGSGAQVVITRDQAAVEAAGYRPQSVAWVSQVPSAYANLDTAAVVRDLVLPARWLDASRFLLYRDGVTDPGYQQVTIGLGPELAARVFPSTGPYSLADRPGPGSAEGQFNQPVGVAAAPDGTIYVVDQGNGRIELFAADGAFLDEWSAADGGVALARTPNGLGPTGISVDDATGAVYVADTWNHRIVALDPSGRMLLELGGPPDSAGTRLAADTTDDPALVTSQPGSFFGPRDVVVANDEIYVVDTGNERIQVFGLDGGFRRVWGGYGTGPDRLIEPVGIAVDDDGTIYVADSGNARISLFTPAGEPVAQWPVAAWPAPDPTGIRPAFQPYLAFGEDGNLYATSADTGSVEVLDAEGRLVESISSAGGSRLQRPTGIAAAPNGDLLITDLAASAVLRYTPPVLPPRAGFDLLPSLDGLAPDTDAASPQAGTDDPPSDALDGNVQPAGDQAAPTSGAMPPPPELDPGN